MESGDRHQPQRIAVIGTTGGGKTTLARAAATALGFPHIELDALYWAPHWTPEPTEVFRQRVETATAQPAWVCNGNYREAYPLVWSRADTLVWLDLPFRVHLWRILRRGITRSVRRELLWGTNREMLRSNFLHGMRWCGGCSRPTGGASRRYPNVWGCPSIGTCRWCT